jgi:uncharacterized protein YegL
MVAIDGSAPRSIRWRLVSEPTGNVLPIYFVADESGSMADDIAGLNIGLVSLLDALQSEAMAAARVRFCILGFADDAQCYLEPADLRELEGMPTFTSRGSTSFAAVFRELLTRIPRDVSRLKAEGYLVNRPAVFMLTDGVPNADDEWQPARAELVAEGFKQRPNILAFGIGKADVEIIKQVATKPEYAFIAAAGVDTGRAIAEFIKALTQSVISSGQALASGQADLPVEKPEGFISLAVDMV